AANTAVLPSPLWGGVAGGDPGTRQRRCVTAPPPSPSLPHKGGGSRPSPLIHPAHEQGYLNLRVESPTSASTTAMIQNRITICGSVQPSCSKRWWIGAIRNTRLPVSLSGTTCPITDTASSTNRPPTMPSTISCLVPPAIAPLMPPTPSDP